jgi:hypothetical protein
MVVMVVFLCQAMACNGAISMQHYSIELGWFPLVDNETTPGTAQNCDTNGFSIATN